MSKRNTRDKIVSQTPTKVIIKIGEAKKVLSEEEANTFDMIIEKLKGYHVG